MPTPRFASVLLVAAFCSLAVAQTGRQTMPTSPSLAGPAAPAAPPVQDKHRDAVDWLDLGLKAVLAAVAVVAMCGTWVAAANGLRTLLGAGYSQLYARYQAIALRLADHPEWHRALATEKCVADVALAGQHHHFIAVALLNMYEEAFLVLEQNPLRINRLDPPIRQEAWDSIRRSMCSAFGLEYLFTYWERRKSDFSVDFAHYIDSEVTPHRRKRLVPAPPPPVSPPPSASTDPPVAASAAPLPST